MAEIGLPSRPEVPLPGRMGGEGGLRAEGILGSGEGAQEWLRLGSTHHRVAGLKHLAEQDAAFLFRKWFPERIQDTCVLGIKAVWALRGKGRAVNLPTHQMPDA